MLKKSLKIGSILLLIFAMVTFIGCDTGSGDTDPDDTPVLPGPDDPDVPPPVDEGIVTGVTIIPPEDTEDFVAGKQYLFKAEVSGTAAVKTVQWEVEVAVDLDYFNQKESGTIIGPIGKNGGLLTIDGGQTPGTVLKISATSDADPTQSAEINIVVRKPGLRLAWTPGWVTVSTSPDDEGLMTVDTDPDTDEAPTSIGRLLETYGKDIRIIDGDFIEGQHYYVRRVDEFNRSVQGGVITVTGSADEGTITVSLSGAVEGERGPIGITLYPEVFEGADVALLDLEGPGAELVFDITSSYLITKVEGIALPAPLTGTVAPTTLTGTNVSAKIAWKGLSGVQYTYRDNAVATVTISPAAKYSFYTPSITESAIKALFSAGSPEFVLVSNGTGKIVVTLTYKITAKTIKKAVETDEDAVLAEFDKFLTFNPLLIAEVVKHGQEAPVALRVEKESPYYSLAHAVEWKTGKTFTGGKTAEATVTMPAKAGYTFAGTNIKNSDLAELFSVRAVTTTGTGASAISTITTVIPATVEITSAADNLIFDISYYVPVEKITPAIIRANVVKLALPVAKGKPLTVLGVSKTAPFTTGNNSIVWTGVPSVTSFEAGQTPVATVNMYAREGYEFDPAGLGIGDISLGGTLGSVVNLGNKLTVVISFEALPTIVSLFILPGITDFLPKELTHEASVPGSIESTAGGGPQILEIDALTVNANNSTFAWTGGVVGTDTKSLDYPNAGGKLTAQAVLKPKPTYTFSGLTLNDTVRNSIKELFAIGDTEPEIDLAIDGNNLEVDLSYPIGLKVLTKNDIAINGLSSKPAVIEHGALAVSINITSSASSLKYKPIGTARGSTFTWGAGVNKTAVPHRFDFTANNSKVVGTLVLKPVESYTFEGFDIYDPSYIAGLVDVFKFSVGVTSVFHTPTVVLSTAPGSRDLTITLTYDVEPAILTPDLLPKEHFIAFKKPPIPGQLVSDFGDIEISDTYKDVALVTINTEGWTSGLWSNSPPILDNSGTATYEFTLTLKPGSPYCFDKPEVETSNEMFKDMVNLLVEKCGANLNNLTTDDPVGIVGVPQGGRFSSSMKVTLNFSLN